MNSAIRSSFLTAVLLLHSQLWVTVIKEITIQDYSLGINQRLSRDSLWYLVTRPCWSVDMVYYILNAALRIQMIFLQNCFDLNQLFSSLIIFLTDSWSLLECTVILAEIAHDSSIQHLSVSNWTFIILRLSYIEIKLHTLTLITESLQWNYITYWDRKSTTHMKNFLSERNFLILLSTSN